MDKSTLTQRLIQCEQEVTKFLHEAEFPQTCGSINSELLTLKSALESAITTIKSNS